MKIYDHFYTYLPHFLIINTWNIRLNGYQIGKVYTRNDIKNNEREMKNNNILSAGIGKFIIKTETQ